MREVRIYPSNLTRTYKEGGGGKRKGGVKIAWGGSCRENHPTQEKATRGGRVAFPRVGWFPRALAFRSLYYPWGKMGDYNYLLVVYPSLCFV